MPVVSWNLESAKRNRPCGWSNTHTKLYSVHIWRRFKLLVCTHTHTHTRALPLCKLWQGFEAFDTMRRANSSLEAGDKVFSMYDFSIFLQFFVRFSESFHLAIRFCDRDNVLQTCAPHWNVHTRLGSPKILFKKFPPIVNWPECVEEKEEEGRLIMLARDTTIIRQSRASGHVSCAQQLIRKS